MKQILFLVLGLFLCSYKRIELSTNYNPRPNDPIVIEAMLDYAKEELAKQSLALVPSDLHHDLKDPDIYAIVIWNMPGESPQKKRIRTHVLPKSKSILFMWEPPNGLPHLHSKIYLNRFRKIYTYDDSLVDGKRFFKLYYPVMFPMIQNVPHFKEKKLLAFVFSNKTSSEGIPNDLYPERKKLIEFFEEKPEGEFEFYGLGWEQFGYKNYKGMAESKLEVIKNFKFTVAYENSQHLGYITEKIFNCFEAGSVPIYWGAPNILSYIPKNCFIDRRDFSSNEELYLFLKKMN
jgi:hypothetical protein